MGKAINLFFHSCQSFQTYGFEKSADTREFSPFPFLSRGGYLRNSLLCIKDSLRFLKSKRANGLGVAFRAAQQQQCADSWQQRVLQLQ